MAAACASKTTGCGASAPAHFGHINFRGTMRFGIERFAQSLIDDQAGSARQLRLV